LTDSGKQLLILLHKSSYLIHFHFQTVAQRKDFTEDLHCYVSLCELTFAGQDTLATHVQVRHNSGKLVKCQIVLFPKDAGGIPPAALATFKGNSDSEGSKDEVSSGQVSTGPPSEEDSTSEVINEGTPGPSRGTPQQPFIRTTPYDRSTANSSPSASPTPRISGSFDPHQSLSIESLSRNPLPRQSGVLHSPSLSVPSPLTQVVFSRPASQSGSGSSDKSSSSSSTDGMNVDEDDTDILVRASLAIIPLHYLQTLPTPKLLTCTTCLRAFQPSSALSYVHEHKINLIHADKDMLKKILKAHNFVKESKDVPCPKRHNPPIEGIMIHNRGLACDLCDYCAIKDLTMRNHFAASHKGTPGFSKVNSSP